jgi:hypothetical protein
LQHDSIAERTDLSAPQGPSSYKEGCCILGLLAGWLVSTDWPVLHPQLTKQAEHRGLPRSSASVNSPSGKGLDRSSPSMWVLLSRLQGYKSPKSAVLLSSPMYLLVSNKRHRLDGEARTPACLSAGPVRLWIKRCC